MLNINIKENSMTNIAELKMVLFVMENDTHEIINMKLNSIERIA